MHDDLCGGDRRRVNAGPSSVNGSPPSVHKPTAGRIELPARAASAIVMGVAAVGAVFTGGLVFAAIVAVAAIAALREWHRLINGGRLAREMIPTSSGDDRCGAAGQSDGRRRRSRWRRSRWARSALRCPLPSGASRCCGRFRGTRSARSISGFLSCRLRCCARTLAGARSSAACSWPSGPPIRRRCCLAG